MFKGTGVSRVAIGLVFTLSLTGLLGCSDSGSEVATITFPQRTAVPALAQTETPEPPPMLTPTVGSEPTIALHPTATAKLMPKAQPASTPVPTSTAQPTAAPVPTSTAQPTAAPVPTSTPQSTAAPVPTSTPPPKANSIGVGTHLVGTHIEPGIYMGLAGTEGFDSCYWERLSGLGGESSEIIANDNAKGRFYVEVSPTDIALSTRCELTDLDEVPSTEGFPTQLLPGTYLVGRDIEPGIYAGLAGTEVLDSCYWARLTGVSGESSEIIANDNAKGRFYVEVSPTDIALSTRCELTDLDEVHSTEGFPTQLLPGTYIVGRDIQPGTYSGEAGTGVLDSCYWARLTGVSGESSEIIANDNAQGRYFVQVSPTDIAVKFSCAVTKET